MLSVGQLAHKALNPGKGVELVACCGGKKATTKKDVKKPAAKKK